MIVKIYSRDARVLTVQDIDEVIAVINSDPANIWRVDVEGVDTSQATIITDTLINCHVDINELSFISDNFTDEGMSAFISDLSHLKLEENGLTIGGHFSDDVLSAMQFNGTHFEDLSIEINASDAGLLKLCENLSESSIHYLYLNGSNISAEGIESLDISHTNTLGLALTISSEDQLAAISHILEESTVEDLVIYNNGNHEVDFSQLDLKGTNVGDLILSGFNGSELADLSLEDTNVNELWLGNTHFSSLEELQQLVKNAPVEHITFDECDVLNNFQFLENPSNFEEVFRDLIKDTSIQDIRVWGSNLDFTVTNTHVHLDEDNISVLPEKTEVLTLTDVISDSKPMHVNALQYSDVLSNTNNLFESSASPVVTTEQSPPILHVEQAPVVVPVVDMS